MTHLSTNLNSTNRSEKLNLNMGSDKETAAKEVTVIQENNACREDVEGLPKGREQVNRPQ